jgi:hypothetical protein
MKTLFFFLFLTMTSFPVLLFSQFDEWVQKGLDSKDPKEAIEYYSKSIKKMAQMP